MTTETDPVEAARVEVAGLVCDYASPPIRGNAWGEIYDTIDALVAAAEQRGREAALKEFGLDGHTPFDVFHSFETAEGEHTDIEAQVAALRVERDRLRVALEGLIGCYDGCEWAENHPMEWEQAVAALDATGGQPAIDEKCGACTHDYGWHQGGASGTACNDGCDCKRFDATGEGRGVLA